jgi:hypothetical protein
MYSFELAAWKLLLGFVENKAIFKGEKLRESNLNLREINLSFTTRLD